ncbi:MAG: VOC family protein [Gemmatimonadota bacterium]|nr:VOC family protein [Gemmatimonadota bacterium]
MKLVPSLGVEDIERSLAFYRDHFGFEVTTDHAVEGELVWCCLRSEGAELMLQQLGPDHPTPPDPPSWVLYLSPPDVRELHAQLKAGGVEVSPLEPTSYGTVECFAKDPDGYELWISAEATSEGSGQPA